MTVATTCLIIKMVIIAMKERVVKPKRYKWCITQLLTAHWPVPSPSLSSEQWLPASSSQLMYWARCSVVWSIALATWGQLSWPCPLLAPCALV